MTYIISSSSFTIIRHWHLNDNTSTCIRAVAYLEEGTNWGTVLLFLHFGMTLLTCDSFPSPKCSKQIGTPSHQRHTTDHSSRLCRVDAPCSKLTRSPSVASSVDSGEGGAARRGALLVPSRETGFVVSRNILQNYLCFLTARNSSVSVQNSGGQRFTWGQHKRSVLFCRVS